MPPDRFAKGTTPLTLDRVFSYQGRKVAWGKVGQGPPLILVHGTPFSSQVWRRIVPWLAPHWSVHFHDLLGYGQSDMTDEGDVSLGIQNGLLAALFAEWGVREPDVVCHDFGAATVLRAHILDGLTYRKVVIFDAVALTPWGSPFVAHVRQHRPAFAGLPGYAHDALLRAYVQGAAFQTLPDEAMAIHTAPWRGAIGQAAFYRQIAQMDARWTDEVAPRYGRFAQAVQVLWGAEDAWIPVETGRRFARLVSERPMIEVPACSHLMQEDAPEAIVAVMMAFGRERIH